MKIEAVDLFYLSMPQVHDIGDGSQDALLVRVCAGGQVGWGECEAAPLVSIASWNCPMSHGACKPVSASILGQRIDDVEDIRRVNRLVRLNSFDLLQADHTLSGIDIALWDLLGRKHQAPIYELLNYRHAHPKTAYASQLFGNRPEATFEKGRAVCESGYRAAKFGWGPYGKGTPEEDEQQVRAAREGLGDAADLLVDAGTIWGDDIQAAQKRLKALHESRVLWLEEPFVSGALEAYRKLAGQAGSLGLAGGEGCHDFHQARNMIDLAGLRYVQIDAGRIGGITTAHQVAEYARDRNVTFVNHTFTTPLALSASIQPYAGLEAHRLCEYPVEATPLARNLTTQPILPDRDGNIRLPEGPGLGLEINLDTVRQYLQDVEISIGGRLVYKTPQL